MSSDNGSVLMGMIWMFVISLLLFWLPGLGSLIAGIVGGKVAGGVLKGLLAGILPGILMAVFLFFFSSAFTGLPLVGAIFAGSGMILYLICVPVLLIGALTGGACRSCQTCTPSCTASALAKLSSSCSVGASRRARRQTTGG